MNVPSLKLSLFIKGLSGMIAQVILMRELLVSFDGNELTLGIILANWLILVAIGSFMIGKTPEKMESRIEVFVVLQLFFAAVLPLTIHLSRTFRNILLVTPGEGLGFGPIFFSSFLILLPVTLPQGALFTYGCGLYFQSIKKDASSIGKVYALESVGAIAGGILMTFFLVQYLNSFEIAFIVSATNAFVSTLLLWSKPHFPKSVLRKALLIFSIVLCFAFAFCLLPQTLKTIHQFSIQSQWRNLNPVYSENSIYGNITVTKRGEQFTFFANGVPTITTPVPDMASIEDLVHFPMLFHENPESVLILSGGAGGMVHEILKYPVRRVNYVERDPLLLKLVQKFSTPLTQLELSDPRVSIHYSDDRFFINRTQDRFDLVFVGLPAPRELQTNRLFSYEFFSIAKRKMNPEGIIVLTLPGSLTYISPELRDLNRCILGTLKAVFRSVRIVPGDTNLYLASDSSKLERVTTAEIVRRFEDREIKSSVLTQSYLEFRLHERWLKWFFESTGSEGVQINSDLRPIGVFFSLSYWNALFSPSLAKVFKWFEGLSLQISISFMILFTLLISGVFVKWPSVSGQSVSYAIFTTGLAGMIYNLAIIFTFQTFYGYLYKQIGLLIAVFMFGVALSSLSMTRYLDRIESDARLFLKIEICIIIFSFLFPFVFSIPSQYIEKTAISLLVYPLFLIMSLFSGACIGLQFPLASKIYLALPRRKRKLGHTAGLLYGADLLGGFLGGIFGGVFLLPILGLKESCFMMGLIKMNSLVLLLIFIRVRKAK